MKLEWVIVGGGIHGVHMAAKLVARNFAKVEDIRIIDPEPRLLAGWRERTTATGMEFLRSASVHHLDVRPWSLEEFAGVRNTRRKPNDGLFTAPKARPSLALFNAHCDHVIKTYELDKVHIRDYVTSCRAHCDGVHLTTESGSTLHARNVVLAIGSSERPLRPTWANSSNKRIKHIFEKDFESWLSPAPQKIAVIGGGISAGQVALRFVNDGHQVHIISRHDVRQHQFDSDSGWIGPRYMRRFSREKNPDKRRDIITKARHRGSMPPDVKSALRRGLENHALTWKKSEIERIEDDATNLILKMIDGSELEVDRIVLATGFESRRPGGTMVDDLIASASLPCASCGYPIVSPNLHWHPRIFVSGPLAELEIGPVARNIVGAQRASERILKAALSDYRIAG